MKSWPIRDLRSAPFNIAGVPAGLTILMIFLVGLSTSQGPLKFQSASAHSHLGILGRQAPELNLDNWIDADGEKTEPIQISDQRGKVIYPYLFQDW